MSVIDGVSDVLSDLKSRFLPMLRAAIMVAGPASLIRHHGSLETLAISALIGLVAGALTWFDDELTGMIAGVLMIGGTTMGPVLADPWWQPVMICVSSFVLAGMAPLAGPDIKALFGRRRRSIAPTTNTPIADSR